MNWTYSVSRFVLKVKDRKETRIMKKTSILSLIAALAAFTACAFAAPKEPNIVLIVADDMGYADIGATGVKDIRTPNLDRLAREGTFFSDAYVTGPICVPSRMGIFMGRHQARWGVYTNSHGYVESCQRATAAENDDRRVSQAGGIRHGLVREMAPVRPVQIPAGRRRSAGGQRLR